MAGDLWAAQRTKLKPIHRRIEARCKDLVAKAGRTWRRLPIADREKVLMEAVQGMNPADVYRWTQRYSIGDVLNTILMPERGKHPTERVGRAGNDD